MAFTSIQIWPAYGSRSAALTWTASEELDGAVYHVFRSPDGAGGWEICNTAPINALTYIDTNFRFQSRTRVPHYRVLAVLPDTSTVESPAIGLFDTLRKSEYGFVAAAMKREYLHARLGGFSVFHYQAKTKGTLAGNTDPDTGQAVEICPDTIDPAEDSFGREYEGGFRDPFYTVILPQVVGPIVRVDKKDGIGVLDQNKLYVRMMAFPRPQTRDLIVHAPTDDRWLVTDVVKPFSFRGIYPVAYDVQLELLERDAPEYRVPLPDNHTELALP